MKTLLSLLFAFLCCPFAQADSTPVQPRVLPVAIPVAPVLEARAYLLYDFTSNQILVSQNGDERLEPASLTKLMTAYLTFSAIRQKSLTLDKSITPTADAIRPQGEESRMFLEVTKPVTVAELLRGLIIQSGNDAARVLAETVSGNEAAFAVRMNQEAQRLGMKNTHFVNATGLPSPQHYSTAYDLAMLAAAIVRDFPEHYPLYSERNYFYNNINQFNRNRLLWMDPFVDGMKTGHTNSAGFCLVSSAKRDNRRLISVVLGTDSDNARATESQKLLNHGFQNFESVRLFKKDESVTRLRVWKGTEKYLTITFPRDMAVAIPRGQQAQLRATLDTVQPLIAPVSASQRVGTLRLTLGGKPYFDYPLVARESVPLANVFSRGWDTIRLFFQ
ncbi:D-alanyl-D-alanine carboxypeptidase DacC [Ferriphaselus amnicola]|uniref:serine-type D-Ala-D-Ala carboxypeptidase n=1 Tax=Ferriphaselus amnicola TaxID=1188319 RepID=A0A2Z6G864_9PROT|nr:D-alanyl-D-alanine carboxypeptidase family protein [Ferriphaselus amnicola]BBE49584.1 D-alanyl-D-alanine carboxypeptidase DacC [Ferriphaselus amnicola]